MLPHWRRREGADRTAGVNLTARPRHRAQSEELAHAGCQLAGTSYLAMPSIRIVPSTQARHQDTGGGGMVADGSMTCNDEALAAPLSVLGLSIRASNALLNNGFSTVGDVVAKTE